MQGKLLAGVALVMGFVITCGPAFAHHGSALSYQMDKEVTVKGVVTNFRWANPHAQLYLDQTEANGNVIHWALEMNSPGVLIRDGWSKATLKPGDAITVTLNPSRSGDPVGFCGAIVLPDGRRIKGNTASKDDAPDVLK